MKKIFIKNLLLLQLLNLIIKPVWLLLIDRMAQNLLGSVYGEYYIVLNLTLIANIFLDLGIQNFNNTSIAADHAFFKRNFKGIFLLKSILASLYVITVGIIGLQSGMAAGLLFLLLANQVLISFVLYLRTNINGLHDYVTDSLLSVSDKFFAILICVGFYLGGYIGIYYFVSAQIFASCISFLLALLINLKHWKKLAPVSDHHRSEHFMALIRQSLPYALLFTLMNFYTRMDVAMMHYLLPDVIYHSGIYAQSFRLLDAAAMFAMLFAGLLLPMFARQISAGVDVRPLARLASGLLLMISLSTALAANLFSEEILGLLYTYPDIEDQLASAAVFRNIMLTFVPMSLTFVFSTLLTARKDIWFMNAFALVAFLCNFTLNLVLIPAYASFGASVSSLLTQTVFALLCLYRCFSLFGFRLRAAEVLRYVSMLLMLYGLYFLIKQLHILISLPLFALGALLFSGMLGIFDFRKAIGFFRRGTQ